MSSAFFPNFPEGRTCFLGLSAIPGKKSPLDRLS
jgi:hypothetical protein